MTAWKGVTVTDGCLEINVIGVRWKTSEGCFRSTPGPDVAQPVCVMMKARSLSAEWGDVLMICIHGGIYTFAALSNRYFRLHRG